MDNHSRQNNSHRPRPISRVKTGCRTCRTRKVKCDEGWPVCHRCVATGRACDGYGVWGGGASLEHNQEVHVPAQPLAISHYPVSAPVSGLGSDERRSFEWFIHRTTAKFPGLFASTFWQTLVLQASRSEPAVLHAVLALASAHQTRVRAMSSAGRARRNPDDQDQFTLRQYNKAIHHLLPFLSETCTASVNVTLVSCMVFICMEFLQKRYKTGHAHLQSGIRLLRQSHSRRTRAYDGALVACSSSSIVDDGLIQAFARFHLQESLLIGCSPEPFIEYLVEPDVVPLVFQSVNRARKSLDRLLYMASKLRNANLQLFNIQNSSSVSRFMANRRHVQAELSSWLRAYDASEIPLKHGTSTRDILGYELLRIYHTMAYVLAETAVCPPDESTVDGYARHFMFIITQITKLLDNAKPITDDHISENLSTQSFGFTADMGVIPPLYFTALKCRVPHIRRQAIRLLATACHQEGAWDGTLASVIAREVMIIEETDAPNVEITEDISLCRPCEAEDRPSATVFRTGRLYDVRVEIPDVPNEDLKIICIRKRIDGSWETFTREFDLHHAAWTG